MNPITSALTQGFSNQNILQYLLRHFPHARRQIESALAKGFSADKIVKYLQGGRKEVNKPVTEHEQTRQSDIDKQKNLEKGIVKGGLALGATALGGYALSRALPRAGQALTGQLLPALPGQPQIPNTPRLALPGSGQAPIQPPIPNNPQGKGPLPYSNPTAQVNKAPIGQPQQVTPPAIQQPTPKLPQTEIPQPSMNPTQTPPLPQALQKQAEALLQAGNEIDKVSSTLKTMQPKVVKEFEKTTGQSIDKSIEEFSKSIPPKPEAKPMDRVEPEIKERKTVGLPNGDIGEITNIRQGIATVNANGKEYRRKLEELIESPIPEKEISELFEDLTKKIESKSGEEISRMVNWAGYDPKTNELAFIPHIGALYVYDNISPEDAAELTSILSTRKSTGENFIGAWKQGTKSPIGAAMSKLIQKLQKDRGGKGNEYKGKYEKIYDAFELPKIEAKKKLKEKADEKRKAKKPRSS